MQEPKDNKFKLNSWLNEMLNINKKKEYRNKLLGEILNFSDKVKDDIQNRLIESDHIIPILNGLNGDLFEENDEPLAIKMHFRYDKQDILLNKLANYYDFSKFDGKVNILIHGLMGDEYMWKNDKTTTKNKIGNRLEKNNINHNLYIRYNTGLHISENGRALSNLLEEFNNLYEIGELNMIGHSMGGLLIRSAGYYADIQRQNWTKKLKAIFLIGVPNEGSYLAQMGFYAKHLFRKLDISNDDYIAKFMDARSNGIKDLSYAYLTDDDWLNADSEDKKKYTVTKVRPILDVKYYLIGGVIGKKDNILSSYFGDGLVGSTSALTSELNTNSTENIKSVIFEQENHLSLLESKEVADYIISTLC